MPKSMTFKAIRARQSERHQVFSFVASAKEIFEISRIERAGRTGQGELFGFQRPQVSKHILEIRDYLKKDDAVLPNMLALRSCFFLRGEGLERIGEAVAFEALGPADELRV